MIIKRSALLVLGLVLVGGAAQAEILSSIAVGPRPESITRGWGGKFYVSIQGPSGALGVFDGEVRQLDINTGVVTPFASGMENPRGITFTGSFLAVADQLRVFKIDQAGNVTVLAEGSQFPFPVNFFNDAATEEGGKAVYVTEMGRRDLIREVPPSPNAPRLIPVDADAAFNIPAISRVYRISIDGLDITSVFEPSRKLLVINGVTEIEKRRKLLVLDFFHGSVVKVDIKTGSKKILATALRGADGVEQARDGTIFVSSFENGAVWSMDEDGENLQFLARNVGFQTTADFFFDERARLLYVANTATGAVLVVSTDPVPAP
jgi:sugar lactone lactonase YvrE